MDPPFSNLESTSDPSSSRKKRRKIAEGEATSGHRARWRSAAAQQIYQSKLAASLRQIRRTSPSSGGGGRIVREAADRVLAAAARGRSRWSRAILSRRLRRHKKAKIAAAGAPRRLHPAEPRRLPAAERRARVLARLVPGCRKLPFPSLLDEATDYIAALQMQVRAMTALTELLAGGATGGAAGQDAPS